MGAKRVIWHLGFERNLRRRGSPAFEIRAEVPLSEEPSRVDYFLLRKLPRPTSADHDAQTLRRLWPLLPSVTVVEYKSPTHPYRTGDLDRLWGYVHTYFAAQCALPRTRADGSPLAETALCPDVTDRTDLCAVLVVSRRTPTLDADVASMALTWEDLGDGYFRPRGGLFTLYVLELDVVGPAEHDDLLYSFGHGPLRSPEARRFWTELVGNKEIAMSMQDMEGYEELLNNLLDSLPTEQLLAHCAPEQRLAGLDRDHQALALPLEILRSVSEEYIRSLSPATQAELRRRLQQNGH